MSGKFFLPLMVLLLVFTACAGSPSSQGPVFGGEMAPMDRSPAAAAQPDWLWDPYNRYNRQEYLAAVGSASTRLEAERNALAALIAQFGQSIQVDEKISTTYQEAVRSGFVNWSEHTTNETVIALSTSMDTLIGAEMGEAWVDPRGTHYVVALLHRNRAARVYTDMLRANLTIIEDLSTSGERNSLEAYARFQLAAAMADVNITYGNLLQQIGAPYPGILNGDTYRLEAAAILRSIPVTITVSKEEHVDRAGRIQGAFARALSSLGFQSGGTNSPYVLDVNVTLTPVEITNNPNIWSRIEVSANLMDSLSLSILLPYNFNSREGHTSQGEADNRAIIVAERRINDEYPGILNDFISNLVLR